MPPHQMRCSQLVNPLKNHHKIYHNLICRMVQYLQMISIVEVKKIINGIKYIRKFKQKDKPKFKMVMHLKWPQKLKYL